MVYGWKQPLPMLVPLTGGGDGVCGYECERLMMPGSTMPKTKLAMMNFNGNARK